MTGVRIDGVTADYCAAPVLADLSLDVASGEVVAVLGASGSGKTTLLRVLAGFLRPSAGEVRFGDRVVSGPSEWVPPERRRVGIVPQEGALFPHLDVARNVAFGLPRGSDDAASSRCWRSSACRGSARVACRSCRAASSSASPSPARSRRNRTSCCSTSRSPRSTRRCACDCGARCARCWRRPAPRPCSSPTTRRRRCPSPTGWRWCATGRVVQVASPDDLYERPVDLDTARFVGEVVELDASVVADGIVTCSLGDVHVPGAPAEGTRGVIVLRPEQLAVVDERGVGTAAGPRRPGHRPGLLVPRARQPAARRARRRRRGPRAGARGARRPAGGPRAGRRRRNRPAVYTPVTAENDGIHTNR